MIDIIPNNFPNDQYKKEIWEFLNDDDIEDLVPYRYKISTFGRLYDCKTNRIFPNENSDNSWYPNHLFRLTNGRRIGKNIHPLVVKKFKPLYNCNATDIDHIDGIKYHNWVWNLEPVTHLENGHRASENGLLLVGEDHPATKLTNIQVEKICKFISEGYTQKQIMTMMEDEIPNLMRQTVNDIKEGRSWTFISNKYDFSNAYQREECKDVMDESLVRSICAAIEEFGNIYSARQLAIIAGFDLSILKDNEKIVLFDKINRIRRKELFKDIVKDYNF